MSRKWHAVDRARQSEISACIAWVLSNWFSQRCSANCPIFQLRHYNVIWTLEMSSALNIRTALSCNLLLPYSASQWADGIATIIKTSPHVQARSSVYAVYVCLTRTVLLSPVCCSAFKEKHDCRTLRVKISVRRRWSWESLSPLRFVHRPCSQVQDSITKMAGGEERELMGERLQRKTRKYSNS